MVSLLSNSIDRLVATRAEFAIYKNKFEEQVHIILPDAPSFPYTHLSELVGHKCFAMSPFNDSERLRGVAMDYRKEINLAQLGRLLDDGRLTGRAVEHQCLISADDSPARYDQAYAAFSAALEEGRAEKLVLASMHRHPITRSLGDIFFNACRRYPHAFVYLLYTAASGMWFGATPELLCTIKRDELTTMALAGTQPVREDGRYDWDQKNSQEQNIVAEYLRTQLSGYCDTVILEGPYTQIAGPVAHLRTDLKCVLKPGLMDNIVRVLHPTPAVCGMPKNQALDFILSHENLDRMYYTGFLGTVDSLARKSALYVNLRSMYIHDGQAYMFAGSGLLRQSDIVQEKAEVQIKLETLKSLL